MKTTIVILICLLITLLLHALLLLFHFRYTKHKHVFNYLLQYLAAFSALVGITPAVQMNNIFQGQFFVETAERDLDYVIDRARLYARSYRDRYRSDEYLRFGKIPDWASDEDKVKMRKRAAEAAKWFAYVYESLMENPTTIDWNDFSKTDHRIIQDGDWGGYVAALDSDQNDMLDHLLKIPIEVEALRKIRNQVYWPTNLDQLIILFAPYAIALAVASIICIITSTWLSHRAEKMSPKHVGRADGA